MQAAKENLDKALEYQPKNSDIYRFYAYYYEQVKETDKAESFYKKSISLDSENGDTYHYYGTFLCRKGDYKEAEEVFLKAVKLPNYTNVSNSYRNAAICAEEAGDNEKAIYYYQYALSHSPNSTAINLSLAKLNITEKNYTEAQRNLFKFVSTSGQTAESLWQWIRLSYATGKQASLDKYSRDLLQKFPDSQQALNYLNNEFYE